MTEAEWLACDNPALMLIAAGRKTTVRKTRLLGCACCRRIWSLVDDPACREAVEAAERAVDTRGGRGGLAAASRRTRHVTSAANKAVVCLIEQPFTISLVIDVCVCAADAVGFAASDDIDESVAANRVESRAQADLVRCIFPSPFRPVALDPTWLTPTVVALAEGVYADRAWDRLPVLADALDDAGCHHPDLIGHLRGPGPHTRGCWAVDLVLGKT